ncbi:AAEL005759-PA [Aedes aegypti]|nr:AAEL005759-PA [Aedes aegypti]
MSISLSSLVVVVLIVGPYLCFASNDLCVENKFLPSCISPCLVATYEEIIDLPNHPEKLLIDVRKPEEISCTGSIPTSINIPLAFVGQALLLSAEEFQCKYGRPKPCYSDPIIFTCREGNRAGEAANVAFKMGYTNVKNYVGSWAEYGAKHGLPIVCPC